MRKIRREKQDLCYDNRIDLKMLTSHELFGFMSPNLANEIITFTFENEKPAYRATLNAVAEFRHVRPVFLERQAKSQRHATMAAALAKPSLELAAGNLL